MKGSDAVHAAYLYLRLSNEDQREGESGSITNQRNILEDYCKNHQIAVSRVFADDDYSGGNFNRPGFQAMLRALQAGGEADMVITKDLSRLGRDMSESSYYAERFFPEHGIRYIAVYDNFDSEQENFLAPFQFAINDVYLRDSSKKIKTALHSMMDRGEYCFRAPYGYKKDPADNHRLLPNEETAPVVRRIFELAGSGLSTWAIAETLSREGVYPPLKYRVYAVEGLRSGNAAAMSDAWNNTTVKRILKNPVYLGHTVLGKTKKLSPKSEQKRPVPKDQWRVTENTHEPLVSRECFERASRSLGKRRRDYEQQAPARKSVFGGLVYCACCGGAMCSSGTVYRGEREKYWYLSCQNIPRRSKKPCPGGARIRYALLLDTVRRELNELISLSEEEKQAITRQAMAAASGGEKRQTQEKRLAELEQRLKNTDAMSMKIYEDLVAGLLDQDAAHRLLDKLRQENAQLTQELSELRQSLRQEQDIASAYRQFFALTEGCTRLEELGPEILSAFIERIEVEPKRSPPGANSKTASEQTIHIYYKFIGDEAPGLGKPLV